MEKEDSKYSNVCKEVSGLDKSIPFYSIIMMRPASEFTNTIVLPEGFSYKSYEPGDEHGWAEIETSVGEFDTVEDALNCHKGYLNQEEVLRKRQWFIKDPKGKLVATATGWHQKIDNKEIPVVHALSCLPEYQGMGLGFAVASQMIDMFCKLDKGKDIWLDTQTWSYKAIGLYLKLGSIPMKKKTYSEVPNQFDDAVLAIKNKMKPGIFKKFCDSAE